MRKLIVLCAAAMLALSGCGAKQAASQDGKQSGSTDLGSLSILADEVGARSSAKQGVHVTIAMDAAGQSFNGKGDMKFGADPLLEMAVSAPGVGEITMRLVGDAFYLKLPTELQPGKPWLKIDTAGTDPVSKALGASLRQIKTNGDPSQTLKQMAGAGEIISTVHEQRNGVPTTHYTITIDVKKLVAKQQDPALKDALEKATETGTTSFPLEVWLNGENLPVRLTMDQPIKNPVDQKVGRLKMTVDYSDWGKPVSVTAPPADQVGEFPH